MNINEQLEKLIFKILNEAQSDVGVAPENTIDILDLDDNMVRSLITRIYAKLRNVEVDRETEEKLAKLSTKFKIVKQSIIQLLLIGLKLKMQNSTVQIPAAVFETFLSTFNIDGVELFKVLNINRINQLLKIYNLSTKKLENALIHTGNATVNEDAQLDKILYNLPSEIETSIITAEDIKEIKQNIENSSANTVDTEVKPDDKNVDQKDAQTEIEMEYNIDETKIKDSINYQLVNSFWNRIKNKKIQKSNFDKILSNLVGTRKNIGIGKVVSSEDSQNESEKQIFDNIQLYLVTIFLLYLIKDNDANFITLKNLILKNIKRREALDKTNTKVEGDQNMSENYIKFNKKYKVDESFIINGHTIESGSIIEVINEEQNYHNFNMNPESNHMKPQYNKIKPEYLQYVIKWMGKVLQEDQEKWLQFLELVFQLMNTKVVNRAETFSEMLKIIYRNFQEDTTPVEPNNPSKPTA